MLARKRGSSSVYLLRYKYIIPSVLIFIFKTTRLIFFFSDPNMKSFWFNEDEIHRRRNRLRWLRIYWSRRLDIDYRGVTRLSPTRSQRNGPISDLTQRRMNSEVYPTLLRTPSMPPPYPPHSGTIPRIYRYTRPCSDSERNVKNMERIDIMVYQWKSKLFFFQRTVMWKNKPRCAIFKWCWIYTKEKLHLKSDFSINNKKEESLRWFNRIVIWLETVLWESDSDFFAFFLGEENEIRISAIIPNWMDKLWEDLK